jgi:hypothetical protein
LDEQIKSVEAPGGTQANQTEGSDPNQPEIEEDDAPEGPDGDRSDYVTNFNPDNYRIDPKTIADCMISPPHQTPCMLI